ncbi:MAG: tetratricopeptide repeat protein [Acidobacteria bacterium]|nr:tetratricopeptide repeat protein [Acidobacteriota bacterium]MBI3425358.1 tetratricopeptide repeat protein [Acidobacteriota bacterium]
MKSNKLALLALAILVLTMLFSSGCGKAESSMEAAPRALPKAAPLVPEATAGAIRFLEDRVKKDPDDFIAINKLAGYYLLRLRETGNLTWLELATRAAQASLKAFPPAQNTGGLATLFQTEFAAHEFASARDHAQQLIKLDGGKAYPHQMLGDALLELGEYEAAEKAFNEMKARPQAGMAVPLRLARLAALHGKHERERLYYTEALAIAASTVPPTRETVAWCRWQLGETAFMTGDYVTAEEHYRAALVTFPDYYRALGGLARVRAARGDLNEAIELYQRATQRLPDPVFVAALGDLYQLAGRAKDAEAQYALCEQMARLGTAGGQLYNRQLALFYADHDLKPAEAYQLAQREYAARHDIYGADALAWTALKAGKLAEAQTASQEALRLGTQDARLFYHAGLIARAAGNQVAARDYLQRALKLNPQFDPLQAKRAAEALAN